MCAAKPLCPLYRQKRTSAAREPTSALGQKKTNLILKELSSTSRRVLNAEYRQVGVRTDLKVARTSETKSEGCSHAAKCVPLG